MTVVTAKGLNVTNVKQKNNKGTEIDDYMPTEEDEEFDLTAIQNMHEAKKQQDQLKKQAFGVSHNLFDDSDYGEVRMKDFRTATTEKGGFYKQEGYKIQD